jgi:formate dehydrogenase maturation protein FdhE
MKADKCPVCGSDDITGEGVNTTEDQASQECSCSDCYSEWTLVFNLAEIVVTQREEGEL